MAAAENRLITDTVDRYRTRLLDFIRPRVATPEDAEDIVQEVFYEFSEAVRMMQPIEQLTSWLYTVARNRITDLYRKKKATPFSFLASEDDDDDFTSEIGSLLLEDDASPESEYLRSLVWQQLGEALEELPKEQREVFEMHELQGVSFKEISKRTGESVNTLLSRKRYAVLHLRERLRNLYEEFIFA
jgi:RNA polymerase sigma factor (sigma-70 family)